MGRFATIALVFGLSLLSASCGIQRGVSLPETGATLEGTIKYGGDPVHFAHVKVMSADKMAYGEVGQDGRYRVENVPLGEVQIGVDTAEARGDYTALTMSGGYKGPDGKAKTSGTTLPKFLNVPEKYADPQTSGLKTTIKKGSNTYDVVIAKGS